MPALFQVLAVHGDYSRGCGGSIKAALDCVLSRPSAFVYYILILSRGSCITEGHVACELPVCVHPLEDTATGIRTRQ